MNTIKFDYKKKSGEKRVMEIFPSAINEVFIEGIDLITLTPDERTEFIELQKIHEEKMKFYIKKSFRKALKEGIENQKIEVY